jgi:CheY-like chemotaxis protein
VKILFIENHAIFAQTVIKQFLSGHVVTVAPSLAAARATLESATFDLILIDYDLDDAKGDALVAELRSPGKTIPILGVSAHEAGNSALLRAGATAVCSKMHFDRIQEVIDSVMSQRKAAETNALWWLIPGALAGMPMPFVHPERRLCMGGPLNAYDDELPVLYAAGIRAVLSLLNIPSDAPVYESAGFSYKCLPIPDGGAPDAQQAEEAIAFIESNAAERRAVVVHCEGGIGRTGTILASYLIAKGNSVESAIRQVRAVEPSAIETMRQIIFLEQFGARYGRQDEMESL